MGNLLDTVIKIDKRLWIINIMILAISILLIFFDNVDIGFILMLSLGSVNVVYLIISIIALVKYKYKRSLLVSVGNILLVVASYYTGIILLLNKNF